jgi:enoyl-CoA hydratase
MTIVQTEALLVERCDGVLAITINRPDVLNAVTSDMAWDVVDAVEEASRDASVRVITLTGAGRAFCAGADLSGRQDSPPTSTRPGSVLDSVNRLALAFRGAPKPVVALVNGPAVGVGSSFALAADILLASDRAYIQTGFHKIGLMPDGGGTAYLPESLGLHRAMSLAMLGDRLDAARCLELGIFARVWSEDQFRSSSAEIVSQLATGPTRAFAATKRAFHAQAMPRLADALELERGEQSSLLASRDHREGVRAFLAKRPPAYIGD